MSSDGPNLFHCIKQQLINAVVKSGPLQQLQSKQTKNLVYLIFSSSSFNTWHSAYFSISYISITLSYDYFYEAL